MLPFGGWRLEIGDWTGPTAICATSLRFVAHYEHHFHAGVMESFTPSE